MVRTGLFRQVYPRSGWVFTSSEVAADGSVTFPGVLVPPATASFTARYLGDSAGNISGSASESSAYEVLDSTTQTTLELSESEATYFEPVTFTATVTNLDDSADPRGHVEILFDGEVAETIAVHFDIDEDADTAQSIYQLETTGLLVGEHSVHARFVPAAGFGGSATATAATLTVLGTDSELEATPESSTQKQPATVSVEARASGTNDPLEGCVEAFVDAALQLPTAADHAERSEIHCGEGVSVPPGQQPVGQAIDLAGGAGVVRLDGLPAGSHEITLRFTPAAKGHLGSSANVMVGVAAAGGDDEDSDGHGGTGARTSRTAQTLGRNRVM